MFVIRDHDLGKWELLVEVDGCPIWKNIEELGGIKAEWIDEYFNKL